MKPLIVTGSDTGVGKTVICAMLTLALNGVYWKPIQSGTDGGTDTQRVQAMTNLPPSHFLPERYVLRAPLSPHRASELDGINVAIDSLDLPQTAEDRWLIVEGAGGVLVPIDRQTLQIALFSRWRAPVIVVTRTTLGTINHTLLTLEALQLRAIKVIGVIFVGDAMPDTERTIAELGGVKCLGRLPILTTLDSGALGEAFTANFNRHDFERAHGG
jgi:dethiobiotin synthetase